MAKITIEELFYGDKYSVMGEVVKQIFARRDEFVADPHLWRVKVTVCYYFYAFEDGFCNRLLLKQGNSVTSTCFSLCLPSDFLVLMRV